LPQDSKQRLKAMQKSSQPITASAYNHDGSIFAYSVSYDWSRGHAEHNPATAKNYILLHSPSENEVTPSRVLAAAAVPKGTVDVGRPALASYPASVQLGIQSLRHTATMDTLTW
jgi:hypothetical protein